MESVEFSIGDRTSAMGTLRYLYEKTDSSRTRTHLAAAMDVLRQVHGDISGGGAAPAGQKDCTAPEMETAAFVLLEASDGDIAREQEIHAAKITIALLETARQIRKARKLEDDAGRSSRIDTCILRALDKLEEGKDTDNGCAPYPAA